MKSSFWLIFFILGFAFYVNAQEEREDHMQMATQEITANLPFLGQQTITVSQAGEDLLFEGDVLINNQSGGDGRGGAVIMNRSNDQYLWPNATIPYVIAPNHPKQADILRAINTLRSSTNLCLQPRTTETDYIYIMYQAGVCGSSFVGRQGNRQVVKIGDRCGNTMGSAMHEIMHAAGFWHEQSRSDRDRYVDIILANVNVTSSNDPRHNFRKYDRGTDIGNYDYASIMHYGQYAFAKPDPANPGRRLVTIRPRQSGVSIGQRSQLSAGDVSSINEVYPTPAPNCSSSTTGTGQSDVADATGTGNNGGAASSDAGQNNNTGTRWNTGNGQSFDIQYDVQLVPQQTGMSCWAAGMAMLVGWRDRVSINPAEIARGVGYWAAYQNGLNASDVNAFLYWGLAYEQPMTYTVRGFADLLAQHGPLWVATLEGQGRGNPHVRVVTAIRGDGTPDGTVLTIYDPWQRGMRTFRTPNPGSIYNETYTEFVRKQSELGGREMNQTAPIYVAHN